MSEKPSRYINATLAKAQFTGNFQDFYRPGEVKAMIDEVPTVDVAPVIHAQWDCYKCSRFLGWKDGEPEPRWADGKFYCCSRCRRRTVVRENYCPSCGAKMGEEVEK